jgi:hypothetical protein
MVVNTNNGIKAQNKLLKYSYLPKKKTMTLSGIFTLLIERFLPDIYQKYLFENFKMSKSCKFLDQ